MMLRRCIRELSSARSSNAAACRRIPSPVLFSRSAKMELSSLSQRGQAQKTSSGESVPPKDQSSPSRGNVSKAVLGGAIVGTAAFAAYYGGYIDRIYVKDAKVNNDLNTKDEKASIKDANEELTKVTENFDQSSESIIVPSEEKEPSSSVIDFEIVKKSNEPLEELKVNQEDAKEIKLPDQEHNPSEVSEFATDVQVSSEPQFDLPVESKIEERSDLNTHTEKTSHHTEHVEEDETSIEKSPDANLVVETDVVHPELSSGASKDKPKYENEVDISHSQTYNEEDTKSLQVSPKIEEKIRSVAAISEDTEASLASVGISQIAHQKEDGRILFDLIEAIHVAERKQAEMDAHIFSEEKRKLKENYEKELKDARARALMYAEKAAILEKELNKENGKAEAAIKLLEEKAKQHLIEKLHEKEEEAGKQLKRAQELAKAELAAAIANEKSSQLEKISEANLHINALCMAFYARSEEARQTHSVHKLALGALALEDALSKGLPIKEEVDALRNSLKGIDKDSFLDLVLSSLPEETLFHGTSSQMQLKLKFDAMKGILRHFSLIPVGGGGILTHTIAHIASSIKVREDDSGDGIEPLISRVDSFLANGKLSEAADALEGGLDGTEAAGAVSDWLREARNRAVAEQALLLLQSYSLSVALF